MLLWLVFEKSWVFKPSSLSKWSSTIWTFGSINRSAHLSLKNEFILDINGFMTVLVLLPALSKLIQESVAYISHGSLEHLKRQFYDFSKIKSVHVEDTFDIFREFSKTFYKSSSYDSLHNFINAQNVCDFTDVF